MIDRRSLLLGSLALSALTACSSADKRDSVATTGTAVAGGSDIRVVGDGYDLLVPANPSRVVVMEGRGDLDFALMGRYTIVATGNTYEPGETPAGQYAGLVPAEAVGIGGANGPTAEEVLLQSPDLIIMRANGYRKDFYGNDQLARIAPILPVEVNDPDFLVRAQQQFDALERSGDMREHLDRYRQVVDDARSELGSALVGRSVALLTSQPIGKGYVNLWTNQLGTSVAADLGLVVIEHNRNDTDGELQLSTENLAALADADIIFHQTTEPAAVSTVPTWQALPAVAAGRVAVLDPRLNNGLLITATAFARRVIEVVRGT